MAYFRSLRYTKKRASSMTWTIYSMLNSVIKNKYSFNLKEYPRLVVLIKLFDTDEKKSCCVYPPGAHQVL